MAFTPEQIARMKKAQAALAMPGLGTLGWGTAPVHASPSAPALKIAPPSPPPVPVAVDPFSVPGLTTGPAGLPPSQLTPIPMAPSGPTEESSAPSYVASAPVDVIPVAPVPTKPAIAEGPPVPPGWTPTGGVPVAAGPPVPPGWTPGAASAPAPTPAPTPAPAPSGPAGPPPAPLSPEELLAKKKAAVLLPGQDAQFMNEQAFQAAQLAKQNELDAIKVTTQDKLAAEQEGAVAAQAKALADEAADREAFKAYHEGQQAKLQASSDALANAKVDPQRLFRAQGLEGVLQGVLIAMSLSAGVSGAAATGGKNAGVEALEKAIDKDILSQEKDLARQEAGLQRSNSLLAQKYRLFGDMQQAKAAARMDAWKLAGMRADAIAAKSGAESAKIGAEKIAEAGQRAIVRAGEDWNIGVEAKYAQLLAQQKAQAAAAAASGQAKIDEDQKFWRGKYADVLGKTAEEIIKAGGTPELVADASGNRKLIDKKTGKEYFEIPGGGSSAAKPVPVPVVQADGTVVYKPVQPYSKEAAGDIQKQTAGGMKMLHAIDEMQKAAAMDGPWIGAKALRYKQAYANYKVGYGVFNQLGVLSPSDHELIEATVPPPPTNLVGFHASWQEDQLASQKKVVIDGLNKVGEVYGTAANAPAPITMTPAK